MLKYEFESLAGRVVTDEQYDAIEILYMSGNLEKRRICEKHEKGSQEHPAN